MEKVGIIFALKEELDALREYLTVENEYNVFDLKFIEGKINNITCYLVESGMGKVNAARTTQILIDNFKVDYVFNIGVAGGLQENLKIGDIIIGEKLVQHDYDLTGLSYEKGFIPNVGDKYIKSDEYLLGLTDKILKPFNGIDVLKGVIASGDIFCTEVMMGKKINTKFNALCVEMEGASIAQVCFLSHVPFLVLRSISDIPNNNNEVDFNEFLSKSSKNIAYALNKLLKELNEDGI